MSVPCTDTSLSDNPLSAFLVALKHTGLAISPADAIDSYRAALATGYDNRERLRDALCVTLAKTSEEVARFETCFDLFFSRDMPVPETAAGKVPKDAEGGGSFVQMMLTGDSLAVDAEIERAARKAGVTDIIYPFQRNLLAGRVLRELGMPDWDRQVEAMDGGHPSAETLSAWQAARDDIAGRVRKYMDRQVELYTKEAGRKLKDERLTNLRFAAISPADRDAMQALVRKMAKRLASKYSRRHLKARRGHLDVRKTIRRAMPHGGIAFETHWKRQTIERARIVVICDVSRSVLAAAQFLLLFLYCLNEVIDSMDAFGFSDRLLPVSDLLNEHGPETAIEAIVQRIGYGSTDYGRAFADFCETHMATVDRRTTVIILGDGRSNYGNPRLDLVQAIRQRSRRLIWLNPEAEYSWGSGDSEMPAFQRFCTQARTCASLKELETVINDVLGAYH